MKKKLNTKSFILIFLCIMLSILTACGKGDNINGGGTDVDKFPYYEQKKDIKTDGQLCKKEGIVFPDKLWQTPKSERYEKLDNGEIKAYFIESVDSTKVFCYVGIPSEATKTNKVPAVVLVHGATGTAFYDWVQMWVDRGYVAIAMDTEGRMPTESASTMAPDYVISVMPHGPLNASFSDSNKKVEEQWVYHAVASVIASISFISSFDVVDSTKIGITGVSYGGFITCLACGYDDRFSFVVPVYGCLSNAPSSTEFGKYMNSNPKSVELWDGLEPLKANRAPIMFVNSNNDTFFAPDSITRCVKASAKGSLTFIPKLTHGHNQGADIKEIFAFADEIINHKTPLIRLQGNVEEGELTFIAHKDVKIYSASLYYTVSEVLNDKTEWMHEKANVTGDLIYFTKDDSKKHFYILIKDTNENYITSTVF